MGQLTYLGHGTYTHGPQAAPRTISTTNMVAGGTGITPLLQLLQVRPGRAVLAPWPGTQPPWTRAWSPLVASLSLRVPAWPGRLGVLTVWKYRA